MTASELQDFSLRNQKATFKIVKCEPKICKLIKKMHQGILDTTEFPFMGDQPEKKRKVGDDQISRGAQLIKGGGKLDAAMNDIHNNPRLFVYVTGGLSHHEVVNIANLQAELPAQIIPGSNEIFTVEEYLTQLSSLHKAETLAAFNSRIMSEAAIYEANEDQEDELLGNPEIDPDLDFTINF